MIVQSVAMPVYNAKDIAWLPMEGLCNQVVHHEWELIICEERHKNQLGPKFFYDYFDRLPRCRKITYIGLEDWVPLSQKWHIMGRAIDSHSISFLLQATDVYPSSKRLSTNHNAITQGADWVDVCKGYFYSFALKKMILYDAKQRTNLSMAFKSEFARKIPESNLERFIDNHLMSVILSQKPKAIINHLDFLFEDAIETDGYNQISKGRIEYYKTIKPPFKNTDKKLAETGLPDYIKQKMMTL